MKVILTLLTVGVSILHISYGQNLLNDIFRPSIDRGYNIDIGNTKESVGSTIFEGGVSAEAQLFDKPHTCYIDNLVIQSDQSSCMASDGQERLPYTYTINNGTTSVTSHHCVITTTSTITTTQEKCEAPGNVSFGECKIAGRTIHVNNLNDCENMQGRRKVIEGEGGVVEFRQKDPLFVRIAKLLLRVTIALSVTFILYNAILYALSMGNASKAGDAQKKLLNIIIGVIIALSSISIIYLIQSIVTQSLR